MLRIRRTYGTPFLRRRMKSEAAAVEGVESRSDRKCRECGEGEMVKLGFEANGRWRSGGGEVIGAFLF